MVNPDSQILDAATCGKAKSELPRLDRECPAVINGIKGANGTGDVAPEQGPKGIRKLVVTLPERHSIAVIDAQWLANRDPGSFDDCVFEEHALLPQVDAVPQVLPEDLNDPACQLQSLTYPPPSSFDAAPVKQALGDHTLYIADRNLPVIHRLYVSDPCNPQDRDSLLPASIEEPGLRVKTRDLAVSPPTTAGKRYLYAVEDDDARGGVMIFDVTPGSTERRTGCPASWACLVA